MIGGGLHRLYSNLNRKKPVVFSFLEPKKSVVFSFLAPSNTHLYGEEKKKIMKYLFHSVPPGSHVKSKGKKHSYWIR